MTSPVLKMYTMCREEIKVNMEAHSAILTKIETLIFGSLLECLKSEEVLMLITMAGVLNRLKGNLNLNKRDRQQMHRDHL